MRRVQRRAKTRRSPPDPLEAGRQDSPQAGWCEGRFRRRQRGSASVWVACSALALCVVFAAVLGLGKAVAARHRASAAADLAALAAAATALEGQQAACARARQVADEQGARLVRCAVRGEVSDLTAAVSWGPYEPSIRSRAGPEEAEGVAVAR